MLGVLNSSLGPVWKKPFNLTVIGITKLFLIEELVHVFPASHVMDSFGIACVAHLGGDNNTRRNWLFINISLDSGLI